MKKIFLIFVCYFALTNTCTLAMEESTEQKKTLIPIKQSVSKSDLLTYIIKGMALQKVDQETLNNAPKVFNNFINELKDPIFTPNQKQSIQDVKNRKKEFAVLQDSFITFVGSFYVAFNNNMQIHASAPVLNYPHENVIRTQNYIQSYPEHEPYYHVFQELSNQFLSIRDKTLGTPLTSDFVTLKSETTQRRVFLFKDNDQYVPLPLTQSTNFTSLCVLYGSQRVPQKQFTFDKAGKLMEESGLVIAPFEGSCKMVIQYGKVAKNPFTAHQQTCRISYDHEGPVMAALKSFFSEDSLKKDMHFVPFPTTWRDWDLLELLFLEDLITESNLDTKTLEENALEENNSAKKYLEWIKEEVKAENRTIEAKLEALKDEVLETQEVSILPTEASEAQAVNTNTNNKKNNRNKAQLNQNKNQNTQKKLDQTSQKPQAPSAKTLKKAEEEKKKKREELFEEVKKEGRVKFKDILGILKTIHKASSTDKKAALFDKFVSINRNGSHINFHLEEGSGTTLVQKHGKKDRTYPARTVNLFSIKLIEAMFTNTKDEK